MLVEVPSQIDNNSTKETPMVFLATKLSLKKERRNSFGFESMHEFPPPCFATRCAQPNDDRLRLRDPCYQPRTETVYVWLNPTFVEPNFTISANFNRWTPTGFYGNFVLEYHRSTWSYCSLG